MSRAVRILRECASCSAGALLGLAALGLTACAGGGAQLRLPTQMTPEMRATAESGVRVVIAWRTVTFRVPQSSSGKEAGGGHKPSTEAAGSADRKTRADWHALARAAVRRALISRGYFQVAETDLDVEGKKPSVVRKPTKADSRPQHSADLILYVFMPEEGLEECLVEPRFSLILTILTAGAIPFPLRGVRYDAVPLRARLVNVETGRSLSANAFRVVDVANWPFLTKCPARDPALMKDAIQRAADELVAQISPRMAKSKVDFAHSTDELPTDRRADVDRLLGLGISAAQATPPDWKRAGALWTEAQQRSANRSAAAEWNLALLKWLERDWAAAEKHFAKAWELGGLAFRTMDRRRARTLFDQAMRGAAPPVAP